LFAKRTTHFALALAGCAWLAACNGADKAAISAVLDARDAAISQRDIAAYSALIDPQYQDRGRAKVDMVAQMIHLFDRFDRMDMHSFDRTIRIVDDDHAQCIQSYRLRVHADGQWRTMTNREELTLTHTAAGWKISGGL